MVKPRAGPPSHQSLIPLASAILQHRLLHPILSTPTRHLTPNPHPQALRSVGFEPMPPSTLAALNGEAVDRALSNWALQLRVLLLLLLSERQLAADVWPVRDRALILGCWVAGQRGEAVWGRALVGPGMLTRAEFVQCVR